MRNKKFLFSIIILVYNEEKTIGKLINDLYNAGKNYNTEIIVVDSGSIDKTPLIVKELKKKIKRIKYISIKQAQFNYGKTRNLGVKLAKGKYVCFISADACLLTPKVFDYFYEDLSRDNSAVAIFGKQIPFPNTKFFIKLEILSRFEQLDKYRRQSNKIIIQNEQNKLAYQKNNETFLLYFLSNVFSCYKRSFLLRNHFANVMASEDILMGKKIIESGFTKIYDPRCVIMHSHDFNLTDYYKKQKEEMEAFFSFKLGERLKNNIVYKIKKLIKMKDENFLIKIGYLFQVLFFYLIKLVVYSDLRMSRYKLFHPS